MRSPSGVEGLIGAGIGFPVSAPCSGGIRHCKFRMPDPRADPSRTRVHAFRAVGLPRPPRTETHSMTAKRKKSPAKKKSKKHGSGKRAPAAPRPDEMPPEVLEFITAIDEYKRSHQRPFPSWSEILEIIKNLGYEQAHSCD